MVRAGIAHLQQQKCYDVYSEFLGNPVRMVFKPKKKTWMPGVHEVCSA